MSRYPAAIWRESPKHGYNHGTNDAHLGQGICAHSMEGSLAAAFGRLDGPDEASWHFSVAKDGRIFQHVDTMNIAWANGSEEANSRFWSIEHEGVAGEALTPLQEAATTELMRWLLTTYHLLPVLEQTLREHRDMTLFEASPTACPSGRIPWGTIIPALQEEDMGVSQADFDAYRAAEAAVNEQLGSYGRALSAEIAVLRAALDAHKAGPHLVTDIQTLVKAVGQKLLA